jgi:uncharacterized membrane protein
MKTLKLHICIFLAALLLAMVVPGMALAQGGGGGTTDNVTPATEPPKAQPVIEEVIPPDNITMSTEFPKIDAIATGTWAFNVVLSYRGQKDRVFDLNALAPAGWDAYITPQYDSQRISSISIESSYTSMTKNVKVTATPPSWPLPDPGEYIITLKAASGNVSGKIDLIAKITARYALNAVPTSQLYNTKAKAGQENTYSIQVTNTGTAPINNITYSSDKPEGWQVTLKPEKIDLLEILNPKTVDVIIKPPPKTVAGDYMITLRVSGKEASADKMDIRVTVQTPTIWGWVGVFIIVVVVVGLIYIFMRFGRR